MNALDPENQHPKIQLDIPHRGVYSAPRRFDIATIMVVTVAYAFLFMLIAGIASIGATANRDSTVSLWVSAIIGLFLAYIAVAQILLFRGEAPRLASMVAGIPAIAVWLLFYAVRYTDPVSAPYDLAMGLVCSCFLGAPTGYLAGATVGGVFLIADKLRQNLLKRRKNQDDSQEEEPW
ncbi:MAG: hypothetical protein MUC83_17345 [Pirellula sp.]|nr:hypothetical protein [Pirellula sp.]